MQARVNVTTGGPEVLDRWTVNGRWMDGSDAHPRKKEAEFSKEKKTVMSYKSVFGKNTTIQHMFNGVQD